MNAFPSAYLEVQMYKYEVKKMTAHKKVKLIQVLH